MSFKDKVVLVTGASQGIGAAIAIKFAEEGAKVAIHGRNQEKLNRTAEKCSQSITIVADVTKDEDCKKIINKTIAHFGKLDILVNNAGIFTLINITDPNALEQYDKIMNTNMRSTVCLTNLAAPYLIATKGNIVNISSISALRVAGPNCFAYATSKAAMDHFGRCVALDLAPKGVRVNTINPGPVRTDIMGNAGLVAQNDYSVWDRLQEASALNRVSEPDEVADLVLFVASDKAAAITGSSFTTDNGTVINGSIRNIKE